MAFSGDSIFWVEVEKIVANPFQPRREFDESKLKELSESIRMYGILQPMTVTRKEVQRDDGAFFSEYELIAGERRLRASKLAGLQQVPVIIREGDQSEQEKLELAIIENLQREDLNAVDRGLAFKQLADSFKLSHAQVAKKVGRSREYVSNSIRLLQLPETILSALKNGEISEGHARTLLMLGDKPEEQDTVFREILLKKLSVREVERISRKIASDKVRKKNWRDSDPELIEFEKKLTESLGTRVQIAKTDFGGKVTIDYFSHDDLQKLIALTEHELASQVPEKEAETSKPSPSADEFNNDVFAQLGVDVSEDPVPKSEDEQHSPDQRQMVAEKTGVEDDFPESARAEASEDIKIDIEKPEDGVPLASFNQEQTTASSEAPLQPDHSDTQHPQSEPKVEETIAQLNDDPVVPVRSDEAPLLKENEPKDSILPDEEQTASDSEEKEGESKKESYPPYMTNEDVKAKEDDDSDLYAIENFRV